MHLKDQDKLQRDLESVMRRIVALQQKRFYLRANSTPEEAVDSHKNHLRSLERIMHIHKALEDFVSRTNDLKQAQYRHDEDRYGRSARSFLAEAATSRPAAYRTTAEKDESRAAIEREILKQLKEFALKNAADNSDVQQQEQKTMLKLSDADVHKIRARRKQGGPGSGVETLAVEFGVSRAYVYQILKGTASAYQHLSLTSLK